MYTVVRIATPRNVAERARFVILDDEGEYTGSAEMPARRPTTSREADNNRKPSTLRYKAHSNGLDPTAKYKLFQLLVSFSRVVEEWHLS